MSLLLLFILLLLSACAHEDAKREPLCLDGPWVLKSYWNPTTDVNSETTSGESTVLRIYGPDSMLYRCDFMSGSNGLTVLPNGYSIFTLINKGGGEYLYFEDGEPRPLTVVDDTTITIQRFGVRYTWVRYNALSPVRVNEIRNIIDSDTTQGADSRYYIFSVAEEELKVENIALLTLNSAKPL